MTLPSSLPSPPADPDAELVQRARAGERDAVEALARWCYPRVYRWALVRTGEPDEADDVTQEVLVRLATRFEGYRGEARFTTWLYQLTANEVGSRARRRNRRAALLERWTRPAAARDEEAARLDELHGASVAGLVRTLLHELPEQQRTVFDLADLQGYQPAEIAAMLDLEAATVRSHLMRGRRAMRSRIFERLPTLREDGSA